MTSRELALSFGAVVFTLASLAGRAYGIALILMTAAVFWLITFFILDPISNRIDRKDEKDRRTWHAQPKDEVVAAVYAKANKDYRHGGMTAAEYMRFVPRDQQVWSPSNRKQRITQRGDKT